MGDRRGFTLVELMIALALTLMAAGVIYQVLIRTQRLSRTQAERASLQSNVRTGFLVVPSELRELHVGATANDILDRSATHVRYRAMRGLGFVCQVVAGTEVRVTAATFVRQQPPTAGRHSLLVFAEGDPDVGTDDQWVEMPVGSVAASTCGASAAVAFRPAGGGPTPAGVTVGSPARMFETMELSLHAADGRSWLGARSVSGGEAVQPVLGPLAGGNGLGFVYLDRQGAVTATPANIRNIEVTIRGVSDGKVNAGGWGQVGTAEEVLVTRVALRNGE